MEGLGILYLVAVLGVHLEEVVAHEGEDGEAVLQDVVGDGQGAPSQHLQRHLPE